MREMVGGCCVCSDDRGWSENPLVYCDGQSCTVAVHQACYGIVSVPTGPWFCRKCESQERSTKVKCELCPSKYGALKRTDNGGWAHVVCALYIPEVRFGNVTTMEPIQLQLIPAERFNKVCYICEEKSKPANASVGACMQCNKAGCKQQFHVTCAQGLGLLCEEAGNYLDNVKYCGYCQHHYSKLKKGGNVKTIPPYKPVALENHLSDSNSEKEADPTSASNTSSKSTPLQTSSSGKRKSSSGGKSSSSTKSSSNAKSSSSSAATTSKTVHSSSTKGSDKAKPVISSSTKSTKNVEDTTDSSHADSKTNERKEAKIDSAENDSKSESKESSKSAKKRKVNSRTPTPVGGSSTDSSTVNSVDSGKPPSDSSVIFSSSSNGDKKDTASSSSDTSVDKPKKPRVETTQSIISNQPIVALTSLASIRSLSPVRTVVDATSSDTPSSSVVTPPTPPPSQTSKSPQVNSLVVSVPLASTALSPHPQLLANQTSVLTPTSSLLHSETTVDTVITTIKEENSDTLSSNNRSDMISPVTLNITYEKQETSSINTTEVDMELEETIPEAPAKRTRSQSNDKAERTSTRSKKRGSGGGGNSNCSVTIQMNTSALSNSRRGITRSQQPTESPPPQPQQPGAFAAISQSQIKDSPPSSPSSESQSGPSTSRGKPNRRNTPVSSCSNSMSSRDHKDVKIFQNGVIAPHMLGNQLNPNSNMARKMNDHLSSEMEAHSIFNSNENMEVSGPQLPHRVIQSARSNSTGGSSTASGTSGLSSMLSGGGGNIPQTLDQLLERQWEQGSQFLMEQAQHFDIASLLSCLHQLRAENHRLEEHVSNLLQRRDHLLAVNARLAIPLTGPPTAPQSHPHTVNNIHPAVAASNHCDMPRSRHSNERSMYSTHGQNAGAPLENGLPSESGQSYSSRGRSPISQSRRSPTIRSSSAGSAGGGGGGAQRHHSSELSSSRSRSQQFSSLYQGAGSSSSQQVVGRREGDSLHQGSKPS